jgi:Na+-translocating ferredoxin:NAD+ oxidoreductase subunit A
MTELLLIFLGAAAIDNLALMLVFDRAGNATQAAVDVFSVVAGLILISAASLQVVAPGLMPLPARANGFLLAMAFMVTAVTMNSRSPMVTASVAPRFLVLRRLLPMIVGNAAVLAYAILDTSTTRNFRETLIFCLGVSLAFQAATILHAAMRERILVADVPGFMRGGPITLLTAAMMALAVMGFAGSLQW